MMRKLLGAAAVAAVVFATAPAFAAKTGGGGCSGPNLEKVESTLDAIADGDNKLVADKEIAEAQTALLAGKMGVCATHLAKAMQAEKAQSDMMK